jgi:WXG100 family type VII secretion target
VTNIQVPHEEVREIGKNFATEAAAAAARVAGLDSSLRALDWIGMTNQAFFQAWEEALQFKKKYHEELEKINQQLTEIADRFKAADEARLG